MLSVEQNILVDLCFFIAQQAHAAQQYSTAEYWYTQALKLDHENTEIHYALSYIKANALRFQEAITHSTFAMKGRHDAVAQYNRALLYLMLNDYEKGFVDYDARLRFKLNEDSRKARFGDLPYWKGETCDVLHVSGEQGFGDIFQFCRYVPLIKEKFAVKKVFFEVPKTCHSFFVYNFRQHPEIEVVSEYWHPKADYHIQLVSLVRVFGTTIDTIPEIILEAEPEYIEKWNRFTSPTIATCYAGRAETQDLQVMEWNSRRDLPRPQLEEILKVVRTVSLQPEENTEIKTWSDSAGIIANVDLIISADSGPVHLAGAMGETTWLLNHKRTCWRWLLEGEHTPWYGENLRIFRQQVEGDWHPVLEQVTKELGKLLKWS